MSGLQTICKLYGRLKVGEVMWVWDYAKDEPRLEKDMTKEEIEASEKAKWMQLSNGIKP